MSNSLSNNYEEEMYLDLIHTIAAKRHDTDIKKDRTGVGTYNWFGNQLNFNLTDRFPLMTTKRMWFKGIFEELRWMLSGSSNVNDLDPKVKKIWEPWADKETGDLGITYGVHWRKMPTFEYDDDGKPVEFDQIASVFNQLARNSTSRRILMNTWHTPHVDKVKLPWCHGSVIQFFVEGDQLSMTTYQRSADTFIGLPWNIAFYALFQNVIANVCHLKPKELIYFLGDAHVYSNHVDQVEEQCEREVYDFPTLNIKRQLEFKDLWNLNIDDFEVLNYKCHPAIEAKIAV